MAHAGGHRSESPPLRVGSRTRRRALRAALALGAGAFVVSVIHPAPGTAATRAPGSTPTAVSTPPTGPTPTTGPHQTATTSSPVVTAPNTPVYRSPTTYQHSYSTYPTTDPTSPYTTYQATSTAPPTTVATTTTTIAPLPGQLRTPPSTLPLETKKQSGHVSPVFAELSGVGFFVVVVLLGVQGFLTRRGRTGRTL